MGMAVLFILLGARIATAAVVASPEVFKTKADSSAHTASGIFLIKNNSKSVVKITEVGVSCDCVSARVPKRTIPPSGEVQVMVEIHLKDGGIPQVEAVILKLEGADEKELILPIDIARTSQETGV